MIPTLDLDGLLAKYVDAGNVVLKQALLISDLLDQRDMLARRCAEQAHHIAGLILLQAEEAAEDERHPLADAIAVMQQAGVR